MLYNIKTLPLHRVFHGLRFKVKEIGCRDDNQFFYVDTSTTPPTPILPIAIPIFFAIFVYPNTL